VIEDNEQSAQWQSQHGEAGKVSIIQLWPLRQTYVSGINAQRSDIRSLHSLNHTLVFSSIADDEDDKSSSLHIQRQGSRQRKGGRTGDNDDISTTAISRSSRTSCLSHRTALIVSFVNDSTAIQFCSLSKRDRDTIATTSCTGGLGLTDSGTHSDVDRVSLTTTAARSTFLSMNSEAMSVYRRAWVESYRIE